ncbi:cysteine desulfurase family protein [Endomicrobium proavitum]|uniref:cysteine desulfurase n=1 Tax=Endomicrobium proavitum TaxID=1408281 RepID=A0A0G3WKT5_9BACT|nr:cysteine desulfurase family protein [Endomicrobium proavitum]AKL98099.1 Cysteine desulfurase [Endomicrobium proavitum]
MDKKRVYLDNSSTTAVLPEVVKEMTPYFSDIFGNASSFHHFGREAKKALDASRIKIAELINATPDEVFFTGCGTESDNIAIFGVLNAYCKKGHIITTKIEHHAVLYSFRHLEKQGYKVTYLEVDKDGVISAEDLKKAVAEDTLFVSVMHANNEVGALQPIAEIAAALNEINSKRKEKIYFHTDSVQTAGKLKIDVKKLGVDLLSMSGHKFGGPKGVGVLYVKRGTKIESVTFGGHHENGLRPGTENVAGIVGAAKALEIANSALDEHDKHIFFLREKLKKGILETIPEVIINGSGSRAVSNILNVSFNYIEGEALLLKLDMKGIAASSGSACATGEPSHVLAAMRADPVAAQGAVRFSFSYNNTEEEVDYVLSVLPEIVQSLRNMSPVWRSKKQ